MSETTTTQPINITKDASEEFVRLMQENKLDDKHGLRIGVKGGGCAGFSYILGFDTEKDGDDMYEINGLKVYINKAHLMYLAGVEVDYHTGLDARGFVFNNPNASDTCGCGSSFAS